MRWLSIFLALLLTSCVETIPNPPPTIGPPVINLHPTVYIDRNFSFDEETQIINGLLEWRSKSNGIIKFDIKLHSTSLDCELADPNSICIQLVSASDPRIIGEDGKMPKGAYTLGTTYTYHNVIGSNILIILPRRGKSLTAITAHEISHAFSLGHFDSSSSITNAIIDYGSGSVSDMDIIMLCEIYHCVAPK